MTDQELLRYQGYKVEDWLKWLHRLGGGRLLREESIQTKRSEQYDMMMEVFGDWTNVRRMFVREYGQEQPQAVVTGSKKEPPKAVMEGPKDEQPENKVQEPAPALRNPMRTSDELLALAIRECAKEGKMLSDPAWMTSKTLDFEEIVMMLGDGSWDTAKRKIEYAWMKEDEKMTGLKNGDDMPKKPRKTRVNMSDAEMRRFVLEAMKVLGEMPSKAAYDVYANEHGGVAAAVLANHGLGVSKWPQIAAEERTRLLAETPNTLEQLEAKPSEEAVLSENAESVEKVEPAEKTESAEKMESLIGSNQQGNGVKDLVQVLIHGIDATVTIGGLEMQVRLDFGTKK